MLVAMTAIPGQAPTWTQKSPTLSPPGMNSHGMVYDLRNARTLLFGGQSETWGWSGSRWTRVTTTAAPTNPAGAGLALDGARLVPVLFGGYSLSNGRHSNVTWEFTGTAWTQVVTTNAPSARRYPGMVYDAARRRIVLFGGGDNSTTFADTWEFDGTTRQWSRVATRTRPTARYFFGMAYDQRRQRVVLFGGGDVNSNYFADTWEYDGTDWNQRSTPTAPSLRWGHVMAYDPRRETVVMHGGRWSNTYLSDTWEWDGEQWQRIAIPGATPPARQAHAMVFDPVNNEMVMFGGNSPSVFTMGDTWTYRSGRYSARYAAIGQGCGAPRGILEAAAGSRPLLGKAFTLRARNLPGSATAALLTLGLRRVTPVPLGSFGYPGCTLYHSFNTVVPFPSVSNGVATLTATVPAAAAGAGAKVFVQAVSGPVITNAGEIRVGDQ